MNLTRKSSNRVASSQHLVQHLARGLDNIIPTMDRRAFLKRSGLGVGVGIAGSQLTLVKKADAMGSKPNPGGEKGIVVKRTVCSHCSVGCAVDLDISLSFITY